MKIILFFIIFALNCYRAFSAVALYPPSENPAFPGKCWFEPTQTAYEIGEVFSYGKQFCGEYRCLSSYSVQVATCGVQAAPTGCYLVDANLSLKYPDCCKKEVVCSLPIPRQPRSGY